ncbi:hypothetical protein G5S35_17620 [Paraburkholderia tropica]|uniref:hypothetical protein n=1 Tax=Paraburkholderia tropica TaxID=92647 RepID=UPI0016041255|nr:hypothetical protein [Paraburkholderia tropica]QNB13448.1 hypothetical protein G5S35_17620 [Paraburkholderia tropica]
MRRGDFRDPAIVLEEKQSRTCLGCEQIDKQTWCGSSKFVCLIGAQKSSRDVYEMQRCKKFIEKGSSLMGVKDQVVTATQSSNLRWDADFVRAVDRLTALGMSDPLGSALWRAKYCRDASAGRRAVLLLAKKVEARIRVERSYAEKLSIAAFKEWMLDACDKCGGGGTITEGAHVSTCTKCEGSRVKRYSDSERALAAGLPVEVWQKHVKNFDQALECMNAAAAATGGRVRALLQDH